LMSMEGHEDRPLPKPIRENAEWSGLYERLAAFEFDKADAAFPFSARLARDNGWSREYAAAVLEEYRRFLFLAVAAGHPVTPSDQVDQAWHLHLLYTRSYWDDLCGDVLQRPLHHGPTRGGTAESEKFATGTNVPWIATATSSLNNRRRIFGRHRVCDLARICTIGG
jgi:hypothetical protein